MSAGKKYDVALNKDYDDVKVAADYDETVNAWVMNTRDAGTVYGESTDTKPVNVAAGTAFYEFDTKDVYIFHNNQWRKM